MGTDGMARSKFESTVGMSVNKTRYVMINVRKAARSCANPLDFNNSCIYQLVDIECTEFGRGLPRNKQPQQYIDIF